MEYGHIAGVDKPVARLVQGTVMVSSKELDRSFALLDAVYELGGTTFDTAHGYGGGDCERTVGRWVRERGLRDKVVIIGKGAHPYNGRQRVTPEDITSDINESLERFGFDYIDLYLLHRDNPSVPVAPIVEVLNEHHKAGKIGAFGGSNWSTARLQEANIYAHAQGLKPFVASSPNFSLAEQVKAPWDGCISISGPKWQDERNWYATNHMPILPWSSLAGGFFSGRFRRDNLDSFTSGLDKLCVESYCVEPNFERLDRAEQLGREKGLSIPQIATAYVLSYPLDIYPLVGCATGEEFRANVEASSVRLTPEELAWLDLRGERS